MNSKNKKNGADRVRLNGHHESSSSPIRMLHAFGERKFSPYAPFQLAITTGGHGRLAGQGE